jgi:Tfp pilus assembly protein PilW
VKIFDEKGFTLYELLATFTILMIVLPVMYGLFSTGYKLYNKIQIEGQLRDDADYATTMIMNELYSFPFDYIKSNEEGTVITLVDSTSTSIKEQNNNNQTFYSIDQKTENTVEETRTIRIVENDGKKTISINGQPLDLYANFDDSTINFSCSKENTNECESGVITLKFNLDDDRLKKPLNLVSEFGF